MLSEVLIFVSKRLQRITAAILCLTALQMTLVLSSCHPEVVPQAARAHIER